MSHYSGLSKVTKGKERKNKIDVTSNINKLFICDNCEKIFYRKGCVAKHVFSCKWKNNVENRCHWCNLVFTNRGNLVTHAYYIHGDSSYKAVNLMKKTDSYNCDVCDMRFAYHTQLKYHIRRQHFNLKAKMPYCELKKVNQVWFEKVLNSNIVMEIKKTGQNTLLMKRLAENTAIKVNDMNTDEIDLTKLYPTARAESKTECKICHKMYVKRDYKKHLEEKHLNKKRLFCNNCNSSFKRVYSYIKHFCQKTRKLKGVQHVKHSDIRIANVESLSVPLGL